MLVQDKVQATKKTTAEETSAQGSPTPAGTMAALYRDTRSRRQLVWLLAATAALVGVVAFVTITQSSQDAGEPGLVSDGSFDAAEANRMQTLRDLTTGPAADNSFQTAETNRMETLRDLTTGPATDNSFQTAETNRMETLRNLATGP